MRLYRLYRRVPLGRVCLFGINGDDVRVERVIDADLLVEVLGADRERKVERLREAVNCGEYLVTVDDDDPFFREANLAAVGDVLPQRKA